MNEDLDAIITVMQQTYGRDISVYDQFFLAKSLERRLIAAGVKSAAEYCRYIEKNNTEAEALYRSLHITFSQFFRDSITFALLEHLIIPSLVSDKSDGREIRIWSAGCANGQEAYSVAMLLLDYAETRGKKINFRIFATDISQEALAWGRAGVYDQNAVQNVKMKHLYKYFLKQGETYSVVPQLRQWINFSAYDLLDQATVNPPESIYGDFDLVMCSNLLFYYKPDLQQVIINKIQQAMSATGYLVTGETEKTIVENDTKLQTLLTSTAIFKNNIR